MNEIITDARTRVRSRIEQYFSGEGPASLRLYPWGADVRDRLREYATRGKLLRGALVAPGYRTIREHPPPNACIDAGAAMELLQSFLLIHDDIMDRDELRRGAPAIHHQYTVASPGDTSSALQYGVSMGICAGDISAFLALNVLSTLDIDPAIRGEIVRFTSDEIALVGLAQMQDVHNGYVVDADEDNVLQVYTYKTGRYTFSLPLAVGAMIAGAPNDTIEALCEIGEALGRIFQIRDDQLGIFGDPSETGKPAGSDVRENKKTLFRRYVVDADGARGQYASMFGARELTDVALESLRDFIRNDGVLGRIESIVQREASNVAARIDDLSISDEGRAALHQLLEYNLGRTV
jgi:geranylgeranyl diphosphate synthase type I